MKLSKRLLFILPAFILAAAIFIESAQHHIKLPDFGIGLEDKVFHAIAYFIFGLTIVLAVNKNLEKSSKIFQILLILIIGLIYGATDEYHQSFVYGREADIFDWVADAVGIILSIPVYYKFINKYLSKRSST